MKWEQPGNPKKISYQLMRARIYLHEVFFLILGVELSFLLIAVLAVSGVVHIVLHVDEDILQGVRLGRWLLIAHAFRRLMLLTILKTTFFLHVTFCFSI